MPVRGELVASRASVERQVVGQRELLGEPLLSLEASLRHVGGLLARHCLVGRELWSQAWLSAILARPCVSRWVRRGPNTLRAHSTLLCRGGGAAFETGTPPGAAGDLEAGGGVT